MTDHAPEPDEIEVSVFGRGCGECVVVHLGGGQWMVVDSFREPESKRPIAQIYLEELGVDPTSSIAAIVATHWHDDHIHGLADLVDLARDARFACSAALDDDNFLVMSDILSGREPTGPLTSGIAEFAAIFARLGSRLTPGRGTKRDANERQEHATPIWAIEDLLVWSRRGQPGEASVSALSPSHARMTRAQGHFAELREIAKDRGSISRQQPNDLSVVLWAKLGEHPVLLGADLERVVRGPGGWGPVTRANTPGGERAMVFKAPHHGGESAHDDRVWEILLGEHAHTALTPFQSLPDPLPTTPDLNRLGSFTSRVYLAGAHEQTTYEESMRLLNVTEPVVDLALASAPRPLHGSIGQIRFRARMQDPATPEAWSVSGRGRVALRSSES